MNKSIAIVGIHTDIGKTVVSAALAEALGADYWKPVQAGNIEYGDLQIVRDLLTNGIERTHKEAVLLSESISPHAAAAIDGVQIDHTKFKWPVTDKLLLVETAGGVLSPMSDGVTMADFVKYYNMPAILVSQNYLGSINHTLLSVEVIKNRQIPLLGIVMNGETNKASEEFIETYTGAPIIARVPHFIELTPTVIKQCAIEIKKSLQEHLRYEHH